MPVTGTKVTNEMVKFLRQKGNRLVLPNVYQYAWESDVFCIKKSGIIEEFEVKVSRSDFFADFNKQEKHYQMDKRTGEGPNRFWYVVPADLITEDDVPEYAGLMYYMRPGWFKIVKRAPKIHENDMNPSMWEQLAMKLYYKSI